MRWLHWGLPLVLLAAIIICATLIVYAYAAAIRLPYPVCVMISGYPNRQIEGVEDAEFVYEWIEWDRSTSLLAVFTRRSASKIGPVAPLRLGGAHLAYTYGSVVCSTILPEADLYIRSYAYPLMRIPGMSGQYTTMDEVLASMQRQRYRLLPEEGWMMKRGKPDVEGDPAPFVVGRRGDGAEVFRWRWDGRYY